MIKKFVKVGLIIVFLIGVCVWEEVAIHSYLTHLEEGVVILQAKTLEHEDIDTPDFLLEVKELEEFWLKKERNFCLLLNHKEVEAVGEEISRAMASVINNSKDELVTSLAVLRFYIDNLAHVLGLSWQNLL